MPDIIIDVKIYPLIAVLNYERRNKVKIIFHLLRYERMNHKIREAQVAKVPYMLIAGDSEVENSTVSVRLRSGENLQDQSLEAFKDRCKSAIMAKHGL